MFKKIATHLLFLFGILLNAQNYDSIRFENIQKNTSAKALFIEKIISKDEIIYQDENQNNYNSIQTFKEFKHTNYASWSDMKMIDQNENMKTIGNIYNINRYSELDNVFNYNDLSFNRFKLFSNIKDEIVAIKLDNEQENLININEFVSKYSEKYQHDFFITQREKKEYYFYLDDITIRLIIGQGNNVSTVSPVDVSPNSQKPTIKKEKIELVIIYNEITQDVKEFLHKNLGFH